MSVAIRDVLRDVPIRSLWTCVRTGQQVIVTGHLEDGTYLNYMDVGSIACGSILTERFVQLYVLAGETCHIEARPA
jgi:esterase/lipase superfamily enzyme